MRIKLYNSGKTSVAVTAGRASRGGADGPEKGNLCITEKIP